MSTAGWIAVYFLLALAIAGGSTWAGTRAGRKVPMAFGALFAEVEARRTFVGLPIILSMSRRNRWTLIIVVFAVAPTVSAIVSSIAGAPSDLARAIRPWSAGHTGTGIATFAVIAAVFAIGCLWYLRVARAEAAAGRVALPAVLRDRSRGDVALRLSAGVFVDEGGTLEELGWRGFLLPLMLLELDRGPATVAVAVMWWAWHLPREVPGFRRRPKRTWAKNQGVFVALCIGLSVLCTEAFLRTGGSFWPGLLIHGGTNVWSKALSSGIAARYKNDVRTIIVLGLAAVVVVTWLV